MWADARTAGSYYVSVSDEVKQRIDIVEFISRYTPLKKAAAAAKGCAFPHGTHAQFRRLSQYRHLALFRRLRHRRRLSSTFGEEGNLEFREALEILAREACVQLDEPSGEVSQRDALYAINEAAASYFAESPAQLYAAAGRGNTWPVAASMRRQSRSFALVLG